MKDLQAKRDKYIQKRMQCGVQPGSPDFERMKNLLAQGWDAAVGELQERDGWQPIETAPKDGTAFLAYDPDFGLFVANWNTVDSQWDFAGEPCEPTHWRPLPSAPEVDNES